MIIASIIGMASTRLAPFNPITPDVVDAVLSAAASLSKDDLVLDIGSGDGRLLVDIANKTGCRVAGVEYDVALHARAMTRATDTSLDSSRVHLFHADATTFDYSKELPCRPALIFCYLVPDGLRLMRPTLLSLLAGEPWEAGATTVAAAAKASEAARLIPAKERGQSLLVTYMFALPSATASASASGPGAKSTSVTPISAAAAMDAPSVVATYGEGRDVVKTSASSLLDSATQRSDSGSSGGCASISASLAAPVASPADAHADATVGCSCISSASVGGASAAADMSAPAAAVAAGMHESAGASGTVLQHKALRTPRGMPLHVYSLVPAPLPGPEGAGAQAFP